MKCDNDISAKGLASQIRGTSESSLGDKATVRHCHKRVLRHLYDRIDNDLITPVSGDIPGWIWWTTWTDFWWNVIFEELGISFDHRLWRKSLLLWISKSPSPSTKAYLAIQHFLGWLPLVRRSFFEVCVRRNTRNMVEEPFRRDFDDLTEYGARRSRMAR